MGESQSDRRLAENELIFREANQKIQRDLKDLEKRAKADGHDSLLLSEEIPIHFYCECVKSDCFERIAVTPSQYQSIHKNASQFMVLPGHNFPKVERIIKRAAQYYIVEKYITPPKITDELNPI